MKLAITSIAGNPLDSRTWSNAPANLASALGSLGFEVNAVDSSLLSRADKAKMAMMNVARGHAWSAVGWLADARRKRAAYVASQARKRGADHVLCCGTLDVPLEQGIAYSVWMDNSWNLFRQSAFAPPYPQATLDEVDRLERQLLNAAANVFTFSHHVRNDIISHYGVPADRVHAVGCGSGDLPPFRGGKVFADGHLLFVAKHLFSQKGGDLVLEAFRQIRQARPQTRLVLVGNDEARRKAAGIEGVEVHGFVERETLVRFFHEAAMLVQPMLADPWGQVYIEAMKARAVVVSLNVAAVPEITDDGKLGVMIPAPSAELLAKAVLDTYARPQAELEAMTRAAQTRALDLYDWDRVATRIARELGQSQRESTVKPDILPFGSNQRLKQS